MIVYFHLFISAGLGYEDFFLWEINIQDYYTHKLQGMRQYKGKKKFSAHLAPTSWKNST